MLVASARKSIVPARKIDESRKNCDILSPIIVTSVVCWVEYDNSLVSLQFEMLYFCGSIELIL